MKWLYVLLCAFICVYASPALKTGHLLGAEKCTWGPSYWCSNITNAKSCSAVKHCIQTVWEHQVLPVDDDDVCKICKDMVTQARDQLESNQTQEELKEVFEGSCKLIPLKMVAGECIKMVDEFIPELVETLASQMNPQMVCSVAGLCNSARIDKLLAEQAQTKPKLSAPQMSDCDGCHLVVAKMEMKFRSLTSQQVLQGMLKICGKVGSLSDGCTNIVLTYFDDIYHHLTMNLNPEEVCLIAGVCFDQFHTHAKVTPLAETGQINVATKDDELPCKLCEQLVQHLRDLLVANTTEIEFRRVLDGLCEQTKGFKDECHALVGQYYPMIYSFLVNELNPNSACTMMGMCPSKVDDEDGPIFALLPVDTISKKSELIESLATNPETTHKPKLIRVQLEKDDSVFQRPENVQLPIERMFPQTLTLAGNPQLCAFCEYLLHYVQKEITEPKTIEQIKQVVDKACEVLPQSIVKECTNFVNMYGDAFVAILAQEIDPSQVCPLLSLCPSAKLQEVEIFMHSKPTDKPTCPLCLFAVTQLEEMLKNDNTEEKIRSALKTVCSHLPKNLAAECQDFVNTYANELIEMLVADLSPQEVCVYLKLCDDKLPKSSHPLVHTAKSNIGGVFNNEIPDNTVGGRYIPVSKPDQTLITAELKVADRNPQCIICEFIMSQIEEALKNKKAEDEVKNIVHKICNVMPRTVAADCNKFVDQYADVIIELLIQATDPAQICSIMALCEEKILRLADEVTECAICESFIVSLSKLLSNPNIDHKMEHVLKKACLALPSKYHQKCDTMIDVYGDSFFELVSEVSDPKAICNSVGLCHSVQNSRHVRNTLVGANKCTYGPSYWCANAAQATECNAHEYCNTKVWNGQPPSS